MTTPEEPAERSEGQRVVAVVGAGRSGTSAITRAVGALRVDLGNRLKPGTTKNAKGFFEDEDLLDINYRLRAHFGFRRSGSTVRVVLPEELRGDPVIDGLRAEAVGVIRRRFASSSIWGFKSGGTISFLPFWEEVFSEVGSRPSYVLALRNPLAVARSRSKLSSRRGSQERSDLEWLVRNVPYFRRIAACPFVVVDLDLVMNDAAAQLERMARKLDIPLSEDVREGIREYAEEFLSAQLQHNRFEEKDLDESPRLNPLTRDTYRLLRGLATDRIAFEDPEVQAEWSRIEQAMEVMYPALRHLEELDQQHRARFTPQGIAESLRGIMRTVLP